MRARAEPGVAGLSLECGDSFRGEIVQWFDVVFFSGVRGVVVEVGGAQAVAFCGWHSVDMGVII